MNVLKINQELLKALFTAGSVVEYFAYSYDPDIVFVTSGRKVGYFVPSNELRIDLDGAQCMIDIISDLVEEAMRPDLRLVGTDEYRVGGTVRKYVWALDEEETAYFDTGLLKNFNSPELYMVRQKKTSFAVVTEQGIGADERKVVGIVTPYNLEALRR